MKKALVVALFAFIATPAEADEVVCLAKNIYYEARNQDLSGMYAVAEVTLNRVDDKRWPNKVCDVVKQRKIVGNQWICQFSWFCDGLSDKPKDKYYWNVSYTVAAVTLQQRGLSNVSSDTYWYHSDKVSPYWADAYTATAVIGNHIFYSDR